jgi:uncharacterized protein (TIGR02246 family)
VTTADVDRAIRQDVADVLVRYATAIDTRDWELLRSCFTADCDADYVDIGRWHGPDAIALWMEQAHAGCGHTLHRISNQTVSVHDQGASARSYVDALVLFADNMNGVRAAGYYDDELRHGDDGWKILRRSFTTVLLETVGDGEKSGKHDREAIEQLKARYFRMMDSKNWTAFRDLFTDDVVIDTTASGGNVTTGAAEFVAFLEDAIGDVVTVHHGHTPEIDLTSPSTATGIWAMEDMLRWPDGSELHGTGHYHETYEKLDGTWRIATSTLTRLRMDFGSPTG